MNLNLLYNVLIIADIEQQQEQCPCIHADSCVADSKYGFKCNNNFSTIF